MFGWGKNKGDIIPQKKTVHKKPLMKNNPMKRSIQSSLAQGAQSPVISFGFSAGNQAGNINAIINRTLPVMVAVSRELSIKNGIVKKYIATNSSGVTGADGLYIRPTTHTTDNDDQNIAINKLLENAFYDWAEDPRAFSRCGTLDISTFQRLVERTRSIDGSCFVRVHQVKNGLPQVEIIDSMRISTYENQLLPSGNYISNGIEFDPSNRPVAYWITKYNPIMYNYTIGDRERVPAEEILHLFQQDYPTQTTDGINEFVDKQLMLISMGLDITTQALTGDTSNASFSASKLIDKIQQSTFKTRTNALIVSVLKPLYKEWLKSAMLNNSTLSDLSFSDFNKLTEAQYVPTRQISLDPYKDLQTEVLAIENGLKSKAMVIAAMGYDPSVVMEEIEKEKKENGINPDSTTEGDQPNTDQ